MHRRHHRNGQRFVAVEDLAILLFLRRPGEFCDVGAGEERRARAHQHDGAQLRCRRDLFEGACRSARTAMLSVLTGGLLTVSTATPSMCSTRTTVCFIADPFCPSGQLKFANRA